jgi:hypothetical protein
MPREPHCPRAVAFATEDVKLCETDKKPNVLPPADRAGISRRRLLGSTSLVAASVAASFALPRTASSQGVNVLPTPEPPFQGKIGRTVRDSTPDFPKGVEAPAGAPNVLLILTDDVGFGATSTFGAPIRTPNFERIWSCVDNGLCGSSCVAADNDEVCHPVDNQGADVVAKPGVCGSSSHWRSARLWR